MCNHILTKRGGCENCLFKLTLSNGKLFAIHDTLSKIKTDKIETSKCGHCGQMLQKNPYGEQWFHRESVIRCGYIGGVPTISDVDQIVKFMENLLNSDRKVEVMT